MLSNKNLLIVNIDKNNMNRIINHEFAELGNDIFPEDKTINIHYIQETETLVIITSNGEIFQYKPEKKTIENAGSIENGIYSVSWSPNEESLVVATKNNTLLVFDPQFDVKNETPLDETENNTIKDVSISWRGDAKFFSTLFGSNEAGRKSLTRDSNLGVFKSAAKADPEGGVVKSVSEKQLKNVNNVLTWQPSGGIIAGYETVPLKDGKSKGMIIFWEKNGLRHLEFTLPYIKLNENDNQTLQDETNIIVTHMQWNKDSDILAIQATNPTANKNYILLYYRSNYKWFLKKVLEENPSDKLSGFKWSYSNSYRLFAFYKNGNFEIFDFNLDHTVSSVDNYSFNDFSWSMFIDHRTVFCTPLHKAIIPPPMSFCEISLCTYSNEFAISRDNFVALHDNKIALYSYNTETRSFTSCELAVTELESQNFNRPRHLTFFRTKDLTISNKKIYGLVTFVSTGKKQRLHRIFIKEEEGKLLEHSTKILEVPYQVTKIFPSLSYCKNGVLDSFLYQSKSGEIYKYDIFEDELPISQSYNRSVPFVVHYEIEVDDIVITVGLTQSQKLFIDSKLITSECTSLHIYLDFILFTTLSSGLSHLMYVYNIHDEKFRLLRNSENPQSLFPTPEGKSHNIRCVERGSKIVTVSNDKVVFELPRGNLEGICPRLLILHRIKTLILNGSYLKSYELMRQHKIDLNLLFDLNVELFSEKCSEIIKSVEKIDYLNLFLTNLKDELNEDLHYILSRDDIKLNKESLAKLTQNSSITKTKYICDLMIKHLIAIDKDKYILTIMTAYIKENELEIVLNDIISMKEEELNEFEVKVPPHLNPETMKKFKAPKKLSYREVLEYVCWIADADRLYEFSLGTYNLDLVMLVAQQTQKDPKEYIPYLEALRQIQDPIEMKYKVNIDLKRYERAVLELSKGDEKQIERSFELIKEHHIYHFALKIFANNPKMNLRIKEALGDYLYSTKKYSLAGLSYESCGKIEKALDAYKHALNVQKVIYLLKKIENDKEVKIQECIAHFTDKNSYKELGHLIYEFYPNEKLKEALQFMAKGNDWETLITLSNIHPELTETVIIPAIKLECNLKTNYLLEKINDFQNKYARLQLVQENKRLLPNLIGEGANLIDSDANSEFSELSASSKKSGMSGASGQSNITRNSKKSKAPKNLLKRKVKEGSVLEEEWLVGNLIQDRYTEKLRSKQNEYEDFMTYLVYFNLHEQAEKIIELLEKYCEVSNVKVKNIKQIDFEKEHPEITELYPDLDDFKILQKRELGLAEKFSYIKLSKAKI